MSSRVSAFLPNKRKAGKKEEEEEDTREGDDEAISKQILFSLISFSLLSFLSSSLICTQAAYQMTLDVQSKRSGMSLITFSFFFRGTYHIQQRQALVLDISTVTLTLIQTLMEIVYILLYVQNRRKGRKKGEKRQELCGVGQRLIDKKLGKHGPDVLINVRLDCVHSLTVAVNFNP